MEEVSKKYLIIFLIGFFWFPLMVRFIPVEDAELKGFSEPVKKPELTILNWISGEFQKKQEIYYSFHLGFRKFAMRLANQLDYWLGEQRSYAIVGKDNELMGKEYIQSYYGQDYIGQDSIESLTQSLYQFKNLLNQNGVKLFVVFAPSKTRMHPERIPDEFRKNETSNNNYTQLVRSLNEAQIPVINFQSWFIDNESKFLYPLFSNLGLHWSNYAATICADSIMGFISQITNKETNRIKFLKAEPLSIVQGTDKDLADLMNPLFPIPLNKQLGKWHTSLVPDSGKFLPSALVIGDSYYWNIIYSGIQENYFKPGSGYYYYNSTAYFNNGVTMPTKDVNVLKACLTKDVVFLIYAEPNLKNIGNGIARQFISAYTDSGSSKPLP